MSFKSSIRDHLVDHLGQIRKVVTKISGEMGVVDDLTQECVVRLIEKEKLWNGQPEGLSKWVSMVSRNLTLDYLAKRQRNCQKERSFHTKNRLNSIGDNELENFSEKHIRWVLQQYILLPEMQKTIIQMKYFQGIKNGDIAKELGLSYQTVSTHHRRALENLKKNARKEGLLAFFPFFQKKSNDIPLKTFFSLDTLTNLITTGVFAMKIKLGMTLVVAGGILLWYLGNQERPLEIVTKENKSYQENYQVAAEFDQDANEVEEEKFDQIDQTTNTMVLTEKDNPIFTPTPGTKGLILEGVVTFGGKPLEKALIGVNLKMDRLLEVDMQPVFRKWGIKDDYGFNYSAITNADGYYRIEGWVPEDTVKKDVVVDFCLGRSPYMLGVDQSVIENNYAPTRLDIEFKAPRSMQIFFSIKGQAIPSDEVFCHSDTEINNQLPATNGLTASLYNLVQFYPYPFDREDMLERKVKIPYMKQPEHREAPFGNYLWIPHQVNHVIFYHRLGTSISRQFSVNELYDGMTVELEESFLQAPLTIEIPGFSEIQKIFKDKLFLELRYKEVEDWHYWRGKGDDYFSGNSYRLTYSLDGSNSSIEITGDTLKLPLSIVKEESLYDITLHLRSSQKDISISTHTVEKELQNLITKKRVASSKGSDHYLDIKVYFYAQNLKMNEETKLSFPPFSKVYLDQTDIKEKTYSFSLDYRIDRENIRSIFRSKNLMPQYFWLNSNARDIRLSIFTRPVKQKFKIKNLKPFDTYPIRLKLDPLKPIFLKINFDKLEENGYILDQNYYLSMQAFDKDEKILHVKRVSSGSYFIDGSFIENFDLINSVTFIAFDNEEHIPLATAFASSIKPGDKHTLHFKMINQ